MEKLVIQIYNNENITPFVKVFLFGCKNRSDV